MRKRQHSNVITHHMGRWLFHTIFCMLLCVSMGYAETVTVAKQSVPQSATIDRLQLVQQQINILNHRLQQGQSELAALQKQHDLQLSGQMSTKTSKSLLDKASLDVSVAKSTVDSIKIEMADVEQTLNWLNKSTQEIQNQLGVLNVFGWKIAKTELTNPDELKADLKYQQALIKLENQRHELLGKLQKAASGILQLRTDYLNRLTFLFKSRNLLNMKQEQVKDELIHQQEQTALLQQLNGYYAQLAKLNPATSREAYTALERDIYYTNERANYAYVQSLIARYDDQIQQMKLLVLRSNSIALLNDMGGQVQALNKQLDRLDSMLKSRIEMLDKHVKTLAAKKKNVAEFKPYLANLSLIITQYRTSLSDVTRLNKNLADFRVSLDHAMQAELSARQGLPIFGVKSLFDLGRELLLIPTLTFKMMKSLTSWLVVSVQETTWLGWGLFILLQSTLCFAYFFLQKVIQYLLQRPSKWRESLNPRWLSLQWLHQHFIDLFVLMNTLAIFWFFGMSMQYFSFVACLCLVWLVVKSILVIARITLVETTHDSTGKDIRLYKRLKGLIIFGGIITAFTLYVHQLPLIFELKTLLDRLFLLLLAMVSLLLLRFWDVVPNLILSHIEGHRPYLRRSIRLVGVLIPLLMLTNAIIGVLGYVNLILTVAWYEGIFLFVLVGYLILRGLLSDGMELLSGLMIQYVHNGWLWTEAFLKPLDKILRISLFLSAWSVLFLFYGWDKQSPIVERLTGLLHYQLTTILKTPITPLSILELIVVISVFYWTAKWTREFVYRLLSSRTKDMGVRNSIAILSQYGVIIAGLFICLRVLGINLQALALVSGMFAFGIGLGLRDLANNFACGFLILLERPLRVGDIVNINNVEGEVTHIGSRAVTVRTWDFMELVVPNTEIFNKSFTNWTARDTIVRSVLHIKIGRQDNPHEVKRIIQDVLTAHKDVLNDPQPEVYLKDISDTLMDFEIRYFVNIRQVKSRTSVMSMVLMAIWDAFAAHGIKAPYPQQEIVLRRESMTLESLPSHIP